MTCNKVSPKNMEVPLTVQTYEAIPSKQFYYISVPIADVRRDASKDSSLETQALYGSAVILEEDIKDLQKWVKATVEDGYTGMVSLENIKIMEQSYKKDIFITSPKVAVYKSETGRDILFYVYQGTKLQKADKAGDTAKRAKISLIGSSGYGYIDSGTYKDISINEYPEKKDVPAFIKSLEAFLEAPYFWGGVTIDGLDCSGIVYICALTNGVKLPRDADPQLRFLFDDAEVKENLTPGDLLFFTSEPGGERITHIGVYKGSGEFIHASSAAKKVTIGSLDTPYYKDRLKAARRIF